MKYDITPLPMTPAELHAARNHALTRATGNAATNWREPKVCHCFAFPWPHLQGVSKACSMPREPRRVFVDAWRVE